MKLYALPIILLLSFYLNTNAQQDTIHIAKHTRPVINLEATVSYILNYEMISSLYLPEQKSSPLSGIGISLRPEIKPRKHFSYLPGIAVQYITANHYEKFGLIGDPGAYLKIDKGYHLRINFSISFRWTYGKRLPFFFEFGPGIGADLYRGIGSYTDGGISGIYIIDGFQKFNTGFFTPAAIGIGIHKKVKPLIEIISYIDGSPITFQFTHDHTIQHYGQFHLGVLFSTQKATPSAKE